VKRNRTSPERIEIILSIPSNPLKPNSRPHYMAKARAVKAYRNAAFLLAKLKAPATPWSGCLVYTTWYFKTNRRRDRDNLLASMKPAFDGIADAKVVDDDADMIHMPPAMNVDPEYPRVVVTIERFNNADAWKG
tara:strand:- start:158 stop:559 length:402 start_codon:yes stop_codon:yes gene_type:complete